MGARVIFNIKQDEDKYICLYSHWGQYEALQDTVRAIAKARPRWGDDSYCARILVSQIIGNEWDSETGFGLWVSDKPNKGEAWVLIDLKAQTVTTPLGSHSFAQFATLQGVSV